jgi:hypothetical protein
VKESQAVPKSFPADDVERLYMRGRFTNLKPAKVPRILELVSACSMTLKAEPPLNDSPPLFPDIKPYGDHEAMLRTVEHSLVMWRTAAPFRWLNEDIRQWPPRGMVTRQRLAQCMKECEPLRTRALDLVALVKVNRVRRLQWVIEKTKSGTSYDTARYQVQFWALRREGFKENELRLDTDIYAQVARDLGLDPENERGMIEQRIHRSRRTK